MEPVTPPPPSYHDALQDDEFCFSFRASNPTYANPHDLELPSDIAWPDLNDDIRLSSPKLQQGANPSSLDALEHLVGHETSWSNYPLEDGPGDFDAFLSGFSSGVDAGRITGYTECLHVCLADLLTLNRYFPADGPQVQGDDSNEHADYRRRSSGDPSSAVLTLSDDHMMSLFVDEDNFSQDKTGPSPPLSGGNYSQQGECPDDLMASLWPLDTPSSDWELDTQQEEHPDDLMEGFGLLDPPSSDWELDTQQEHPDDLMASLWPLDLPSSDCELDTQQGECPDDVMASLRPLDPPSSDCELGMQQEECSDGLTEDLRPLGPPSGGGRPKSSAAATCIDLTESDDEDDPTLYPSLSPSLGGGGNNSPAAVVCIDLTGSEDRHEFTESDEDDEFPPLSVLLQRIRRPRDR